MRAPAQEYAAQVSDASGFDTLRDPMLGGFHNSPGVVCGGLTRAGRPFRMTTRTYNRSGHKQDGRAYRSHLEGWYQVPDHGRYRYPH